MEHINFTICFDASTPILPPPPPIWACQVLMLTNSYRNQNYQNYLSSLICVHFIHVFRVPTFQQIQLSSTFYLFPTTKYYRQVPECTDLQAECVMHPTYMNNELSLNMNKSCMRITLQTRLVLTTRLDNARSVSGFLFFFVICRKCGMSTRLERPQFVDKQDHLP